MPHQQLRHLQTTKGETTVENNKDLNVATVQEENALVVRDETTLKSTPKAEAQGNGHKQATENGNHEPHQDVINRFNKQTAAVERHSAKQADAVRLQFDEECLNRGYGIRPVAPIRTEELKAKIYKYGFWCAM